MEKLYHNCTATRLNVVGSLESWRERSYRKLDVERAQTMWFRQGKCAPKHQLKKNVLGDPNPTGFWHSRPFPRSVGARRNTHFMKVRGATARIPKAVPVLAQRSRCPQNRRFRQRPTPARFQPENQRLRAPALAALLDSTQVKGCRSLRGLGSKPKMESQPEEGRP